MTTNTDDLHKILNFINDLSRNRHSFLFKPNEYSDSPIYKTILIYLICNNFDIYHDFKLCDFTEDTPELTPCEYNRVEAQYAMYKLKEILPDYQLKLPMSELKAAVTAEFSKLLFDSNCVYQDRIISNAYFSKTCDFTEHIFNHQFSDTLKVIASGFENAYTYRLLSSHSLVSNTLPATDYLYIGLLTYDLNMAKHRSKCNHDGTLYWLHKMYDEGSFDLSPNTQSILPSHTNIRIRDVSKHEVAKYTLEALYNVVGVDDTLSLLCDSSTSFKQVIAIARESNHSTIEPTPTPEF